MPTVFWISMPISSMVVNDVGRDVRRWECGWGKMVKFTLTRLCLSCARRVFEGSHLRFRLVLGLGLSPFQGSPRWHLAGFKQLELLPYNHGSRCLTSRSTFELQRLTNKIRQAKAKRPSVKVHNSLRSFTPPPVTSDSAETHHNHLFRLVTWAFSLQKNRYMNFSQNAQVQKKVVVLNVSLWV